MLGTLDRGLLLPGAAGARAVLRRQRRSETEDQKSLQHAASHLCIWLSQCLFRPPALFVLFGPVRSSPVRSVPIPGHAALAS